MRNQFQEKQLGLAKRLHLPPWSKQGKESGRAHVSLLSRRCRVIDSQLSALSTNQKQEPGHMTGLDQ